LNRARDDLQDHTAGAATLGDFVLFAISSALHQSLVRHRWSNP